MTLTVKNISDSGLRFIETGIVTQDYLVEVRDKAESAMPYTRMRRMGKNEPGFSFFHQCLVEAYLPGGEASGRSS